MLYDSDTLLPVLIPLFLLWVEAVGNGFWILLICSDLEKSFSSFGATNLLGFSKWKKGRLPKTLLFLMTSAWRLHLLYVTLTCTGAFLNLFGSQTHRRGITENTKLGLCLDTKQWKQFKSKNAAESKITKSDFVFLITQKKNIKYKRAQFVIFLSSFPFNWT